MPVETVVHQGAAAHNAEHADGLENRIEAVGEHDAALRPAILPAARMGARGGDLAGAPDLEGLGVRPHDGGRVRRRTNGGIGNEPLDNRLGAAAPDPRMIPTTPHGGLPDA